METQMMFCPKCATENSDEAQYCRQCGSPMPALLNSANRKSGEGWSNLAMTGLVIGTILIPLVGLIFGAANLQKESRKGQATALLILGIVSFVINAAILFS